MDYNTIRGGARAELVEKKSEFIAVCAPVETAEEAADFIAKTALSHPKARHNVYAYLLRGGECKCSDDGEPQGTGGIPALEVIKKQGLVDVCVVITRYFGGILLGGGGLVRAYGGAARLSLDAAERIFMESCAEIELLLKYDLYGKFTHKLSEFKTISLAVEFGEDVKISLCVKTKDLSSFEAMITELTNGQSAVDIIHESFAGFPL